MKKTLNFVGAGAIALGLLSLPKAASAQVEFGGTFRGPHGSFSIGVGPFLPEVGGYVPSPYDDQIYEDPDYGYGFAYESQWVPCRPYGSRWVISAAPFVVQRPIVRDYPYGYYSRPYYSRPYRSYRYRDRWRTWDRWNRWDRGWWDRRW